MAGRSAWVAGNGVGLTWTTAINSADMVSLAASSSVVSSVADIANGTALDQFADISFSLLIPSSTIVAGASIAFWIFLLNQDGTTYGDGQFTNGTQAAKAPSFTPAGAFQLVAAASQTALIGSITGIVLPPGSFRWAMQNASGIGLTAGTQTVRYRTYNQNFNS